MSGPSPWVHGLVRRGLFRYLSSIIVVLQVLFGLVYFFGKDFDPAVMVWVVPAVAPVAMTVLWLYLERGRLASCRMDPWWSWFAIAWGLFGFWAGSYFLVGTLTDPDRVRLLSPALDRFVPFEPAFVFLYLCVYPVFLLPFFRATRPAVIHRLAVAYLAMFAVSYTLFLAMPVAFDRPGLATTTPNFAEWALQLVYGRDPPWNCMPSTHCAVAMLSALALLETGRGVGWFGMFTAAAIGVSTLYTKQHYVVDVLAGFTLAAVTWKTLQWIWRNPAVVPEPARALIERDLQAETETAPNPGLEPSLRG